METQTVRIRVDPAALAEAHARAKAEGISRALWIGQHIERLVARPEDRTRVTRNAYIRRNES